jgi:hypothetical protein
MNNCLYIVLFCSLSVPAYSASLYNSENDFLSECSALDKEPNLTVTEMSKNIVCVTLPTGTLIFKALGIAFPCSG